MGQLLRCTSITRLLTYVKYATGRVSCAPCLFLLAARQNNSQFTIHNSQFSIVNCQLSIINGVFSSSLQGIVCKQPLPIASFVGSQLIPLWGLFLLAARHSLQAASALAPQRRFTIINCQLSILNSQLIPLRGLFLLNLPKYPLHCQSD